MVNLLAAPILTRNIYPTALGKAPLLTGEDTKLFDTFGDCVFVTVREISMSGVLPQALPAKNRKDNARKDFKKAVRR